jgi:hypothetical protein
MDRQAHAAARRGRLTSSKAHRLMTGSLSVWNALLDEIRNPAPFYDLGPNTPEPLAWGLTHEEQAIATFWDRYASYTIHNPRFLRYHDPADELRYKHLGDSPDRMLSTWTWEAGDTGRYVATLEAKCPFVQEVHWRWLQEGVVPAEHKAQCFFHMLVTGTPECWFISFDPRMETDEYRLFAKSIRQSDDLPYALDMARKVDRFLEVLDTGDRFEILPTTADNIRSLFA